jgi:protein phosphatase
VVDGMGATTAGGMPTVISTEALPQDLHSTTIQGGPVQAELEPSAARMDAPMDTAFDDDEIEKAIAEIRGAIEKSSQILK